ncbi:calcium-binding protein, partial [Corallococcus exiguus]|uniref:M10 family metallopeptidase C-terminal domain-containing protein n=1 Tax=Corallococcus exiguus TaxID=83462 RepID=UPI0017FCCFE6|nr:calcium-binding protein [Corallococcus exiguus]
AGDVVSEQAGGGSDLVITSVSYTLSADVENLTGATAGPLVLKGNTIANVIKGNIGADKLYGGLGKDSLTGDKGRDVFVFNTKVDSKKLNVDKVTDFVVKDDTIWLDNAVFKQLGSGSEKKPVRLDKDFLTLGTKAQDADDYLIY